MIEFGIADGPAPEVRADATDLYIDVLTAAVGATTVSTWAAAAVEIAAGLWSRALSTADVPDGIPIGPRLLAEIGRDLARHGEAVYLLDIAAGGVCGSYGAIRGTYGAMGRTRPVGGIG